MSSCRPRTKKLEKLLQEGRTQYAQDSQQQQPPQQQQQAAAAAAARPSFFYLLQWSWPHPQPPADPLEWWWWCSLSSDGATASVKGFVADFVCP
mmetsp:Transcript_26537/g.51399  ORF Transcript_26537/g.51399 Transcript_26537/m.51399 type:complete len:94 (+) Transcript_26537:215-496(+)